MLSLSKQRPRASGAAASGTAVRGPKRSDATCAINPTAAGCRPRAVPSRPPHSPPPPTHTPRRLRVERGRSQACAPGRETPRPQPRSRALNVQRSEGTAAPLPGRRTHRGPRCACTPLAAPFTPTTCGQRARAALGGALGFCLLSQYIGSTADSTREHSTAHLLRRARAASIFSAEVLRRSRSIARGPRQTHSRSARAREREGGAVARSAVAERARGARARRAGASLAPRVAPPVAPDGRALRIIGRDRRGRPRRVPCPRVGGVQRPRRRWATRWPRQSTRRTWPP